MFANNLKSAFFTVSTKIFIEETHKNSHLYGLQQTFHKSKKANYCEVFPASNYLGIFLPHWIATKKGYSPIPYVRTRTTDAQRRNSLHCMAENSIPIPNF